MQILRSERLRLRWFTPADADFILGLLNERAWQQNINDPGVRTREQAIDWIQTRHLDKYWALGHGFWAVERIADGELVGLCGLFKRDSLPAVDVGYGFPERHWGQGYAVEAAAACMRYGREVLGLRRIMAITSPDNAASIAVLRKIGLDHIEDRDLPDDGGPASFFEWRSDEPELDDDAQIDDCVRRFFALFNNRDGCVHGIAAAPYFMLPGSIVTRSQLPPLDDRVDVMNLRDFVVPRAELLEGGRLREFHEWETRAETQRHGRIAQRWLRYRKQGTLDGLPYAGEGAKTIQLCKVDGRWRIAALSWEDLVP